MKLGFDLTIEQSQKLVMTPELIQSIKLLQLSTQELDAYLDEQLLSNPVLEEDDAYKDALQEYLREYYFKGKRTGLEKGTESGAGAYDRQAEQDSDWIYERQSHETTSLAAHLRFQLGFVSLTARQRKICEYLIDSLDDAGYLTMPCREISDAFGGKITHEEVEQALSVIQGFDPPGVGARDLAECLCLQLGEIGICDEAYCRLLTEHLEEFSRNRLQDIAKALGMDVAELQIRADVIRSLNPKPGRLFDGEEETVYIIPDVIMEADGDGYKVEINEKVTPRLKISGYYDKVCNGAGSDEETVAYLKKKIESAVWLLRSIEQRKNTIRNVAGAIVEYQKDFFQKGEQHLRPMTLKNVADQLDVHESTVSRAVKGKYMNTPRGIYELRYFFSAGLSDKGPRGKGEGVSAKTAKAAIKEIIGGEDIKKPLSDQTIVAIMEERGISLSRRTVAKYREELGIPGSSKRRRY